MKRCAHVWYWDEIIKIFLRYGAFQKTKISPFLRKILGQDHNENLPKLVSFYGSHKQNPDQLIVWLIVVCQLSPRSGDDSTLPFFCYSVPNVQARMFGPHWHSPSQVFPDGDDSGGPSRHNTDLDWWLFKGGIANVDTVVLTAMDDIQQRRLRRR